MTKQRQAGTFPGSSVVKTSLSNARVKILSLVGELRFHLPHGQKTKTEKRSNIVTNSIKTLKYGQHEKKKKTLKKEAALKNSQKAEPSHNLMLCSASRKLLKLNPVMD